MNDKQVDMKPTQSRSKSKTGREKVFNNPFVNFLRDFKNSVACNQRTDFFKMAGERWRAMSDAEKEPYLNAAREAKTKQPKKSKDKYKKKGGKREINKRRQNMVSKDSSKMIPTNSCSKCGHKHGSHIPAEENVFLGALRRESASNARESDETSRSRSRSREGSPDESRTSGSSTTFF